MEAKALSQFTPPSGALQHMVQDVNVTVPRLLLHDAASHVLIIEDMGNVKPLEQWMLDWSPTLAPSRDEVELVMMAKSIGKRTGQFFANLHSQTTLDLVLHSSSISNLTNSFAFDVVVDNCIKPIGDKLLQYLPNPNAPPSHEADYAENLFKRVLDNFVTPTPPAEQSFVLGDFYPGSILLPNDANSDSPIAVIDWEFSGLGKGPHADMSQCLAHFYIALATCAETSERHVAVWNLASGVCDAYRTLSMHWLGPVDPRVLDDERNRRRLEMLRSALILYGGEIVSQGCDENCPFSSTAQFNTLCKNGVWYIERAGSSIEEMVETENWNMLMQDKLPLVMRLFHLV
jgi:Phosphotransferase enzyme family